MRIERRWLGSGMGLFVMSGILAASVMGCGGSDSPSAPTPTTTETFTGTVTQGGGVTHTFAVQRDGGLQATLTSLAPLSTITMGLGIGSLSNGACGLISQTTAQQSQVVQGTVSPGTYCIAVFDIGNIAADGAITYTLSLIHP